MWGMVVWESQRGQQRQYPVYLVVRIHLLAGQLPHEQLTFNVRPRGDSQKYHDDNVRMGKQSTIQLMDDSYYKCKCLGCSESTLQYIYTLDAPANANLGIIPNLPCFGHNFHLAEPLTTVHLHRIHVRLV